MSFAQWRDGGPFITPGPYADGALLQWYDGGPFIRLFGTQTTVAISPSTLTQEEEGSNSAAITTFRFTVTRTGDLSGTTTVPWAVTGIDSNSASTVDFDGSNSAGGYPAGVLTFLAGDATKNIDVPVLNDALVEGNEGFRVTLSGPTGAVLGTATAHGVITNTDVALSTTRRRQPIVVCS